jgi:3-oxoacyl-[acyl-carrier protein] reductase
MRFQGKVAIVTGSGSGIGRAVAAQLGREGAAVVVNDVDQAALDETLEQFQKEGMQAIGVRADVTSSEDAAGMVRLALDAFGRIDVLVNNAGGSMNHPIHLLELTDDMWDKVIDLNLKSIFVVSRAVLPAMLAQQRGAIINISSMDGRVGHETGRPHYSAAKAGALGLTRHMAREFGPFGVRVNAVTPGYCFSGERIRPLWEMRPNRDELIGDVALRRVSTPEEQAEVVAFLASDQASFVTGATVDVNGGLFCL